MSPKERVTDQRMWQIAEDREKKRRRYYIGVWVAQGNQSIGMSSDIRLRRRARKGHLGGRDGLRRLLRGVPFGTAKVVHKRKSGFWRW